MMNFGQALEAMKAGKAVAREEWIGRGKSLFLSPGATVIGQMYPDGSSLEWQPQNTDILADDWNADIHSYPTS